MRFALIVILAFVLCSLKAQDKEPPKITLNGYIKDLLSISFINSSIRADNLIHNRLNFNWTPNDNISVKFDLRNRLFFGKSVSTIPDYDKLIDVNNDYFDLSFIPISNNSIILHLIVDRAYVEWSKNQWEIRLGRQRVNWAVNLVWNPNDLFNTYSFFDFDYEERPGSDAILIRKYTGFASSIELAGTIHDDFDKTVLAFMWKFNKKRYDFQLLAGKAREDIALGFGWAGHVKLAGLKGEITYFEPYQGAANRAIVTSISMDYLFKNGLFVTGSILYNTDGSSDPQESQLASLQANRLTVRNLSPYNFSTFAQLSGPVHPLINTGLAFIFYPGNQAMFLNPSVSYSAGENVGLDLVGQLFFDEKPTASYGLFGSVIYVRGKLSF